MADPLIKNGELGLVQFDDWFHAPDGQEYRCAFGPVNVIKAEALLGFKPKGSADWFVQIGYDDKAVLLAGCRIHAASSTKVMPAASLRVYDAR